MLQSYRSVPNKSLAALSTSKVTSPQPELDYTKFQHGCFLHRGVSPVSCALISVPPSLLEEQGAHFLIGHAGDDDDAGHQQTVDLNNSAARKGVSAALVSRFKIPHLFTLISFTGL